MDCAHDSFTKEQDALEELNKKRQIVNRSIGVDHNGMVDSSVVSQPLVGVSEFVKRQTKDSVFTHFANEWQVLIDITVMQMGQGNYDYGYRDGVIVVHMNKTWAELFYTYDAYPMFEGMKLDAQWAKTPGREHEPAKLQVKILEPKIKCNFVDIILYRKDVLEEDKDNTTGADWDIVSINGRLKKDPPPIDPLTLVRNWLHLKGGTEMKDTHPLDMLTMLCDSILYKNGLKKHMSKNKKDL
jgi:hypothetical protein